MKQIQVCKRCVMDNTSDDTIKFDVDGNCNYCENANSEMKKVYFPNEEGKVLLSNLLETIKTENQKKKYDCIMGISGGLDSVYLAYLGAVKWNLRILAIHVDDGFDTNISKENIKRLCDKAKIELINIKPDEKEYCELTRAYIMAGVPNIAIPQDNILLAAVYKYTRENKIKNFLSGANFALECILQAGNTYGAFDTRNIFDINKKFGRIKFKHLHLISQFRRDVDLFIYKIKTYYLLDYVDYNRDRAFEELYEYCGFEYYGSKHLENKLTKFAQLYWFPKKFNVDKRKSHLSSMIVSNQLTRDEAIDILSNPISDNIENDEDYHFVLDKLDITNEEINKIMNDKNRSHEEFKTSIYIKIKKRIKKFIIK